MAMGDQIKIYRKVGSGLKILFIAFLLRMAIALFNISDLGKLVNIFLEPVEKILIFIGFLAEFVCYAWLPGQCYERKRKVQIL